MDKLLFTITDKDVLGIEPNNMEYKDLRLASRGIVIKDDDKIAIFHKENKNQYKLPGGGLEDDDNNESTFKREVLEETGCEVQILEKLGISEEYRNQTNFKQISHIYVSKVINDTNKLNLTQDEILDGAKLMWLTTDEALSYMKKSYKELQKDNAYHSMFITLRDIKILEYYIGRKNNEKS